MSKKENMGGWNGLKWWMHKWLDLPKRANREEIDQIMGQSGTKTIGYQPPRHGLITEGEVRQAKRNKGNK